MKKTFLLVISLTTLLLSRLAAQIPAIEWQNTLGGSDYEFLNSIRQTSDGGYIMAGYSASNAGGDKTENNIGGDDYWVVKLNAAGVVEWENTIGGGSFDRLYSVEETQDGGFILGGQSLSGGGVGDKAESNIGGYDYWVVKLNSNGTIAWQNSIGGTGNDQLNNAQPTSDGGYILAGSTDSGIGGDKTEARVGNTDYWVVKLDASGNITWQNDVGGLMFDYLWSAYETPDGGYILGGYSSSGISGDKTDGNFGMVDYWVVKLNSAGVVQWDNTIGGTLNDYVYSVIPTNDGGSLALGLSESGLNGNKTEATNGLYDYYLVKLDNAGNISWQNSIGGTSNDYVFTNPISKTPDGGYIVAGYSQSGITGDKTEAGLGSWDYWILKLNNTGTITWQNVIGGTGGDYANAIEPTADGGYILGGYSYSNSGGDKTENTNGDADYWVIKLEGTGCVPFPEICNGIDDNCNGTTDEGITETISISAAGATTFCQGGSVTLNSIYSGASVQWKKNGTNIPGATFSSCVVNKSGNYTAVTTSACGSATSNTITVTVNKNPPASITPGGPTTFCTGGSVVLTANAGGGLMYQWYKGASAIAGATSINYTATTAGTYKCRVTKAATGCFKNSNAIMVSVPCKKGESVRSNDENVLSIYPNPNTGTFTMNAGISISGMNSENEISIEIYNSLGQMIYSKQISSTDGSMNKTIELNDIAKGIYIVRIQNGEVTDEQKLIIE